MSFPRMMRSFIRVRTGHVLPPQVIGVSKALQPGIVVDLDDSPLHFVGHFAAPCHLFFGFGRGELVVKHLLNDLVSLVDKERK